MSGALSSSSVGTIYYKIKLNHANLHERRRGNWNVTGVWLGKGGSGTQFPYATPTGEPLSSILSSILSSPRSEEFCPGGLPTDGDGRRKLNFNP